MSFSVCVDIPTRLRLNVDVKSTLTIGALAARFGLATHVLRHWEAMGLLTPARAAGGRRRYGEVDGYRVAMILRAKEAGLGLAEIRRLLATVDPAERRQVLVEQRAALAERIARAQASLELLDCALDCEHDDIATCPHFQAVLAERAGRGTATPSGQARDALR